VHGSQRQSAFKQSDKISPGPLLKLTEEKRRIPHGREEGKTADHFALNEASKQLRGGVDLARGRHHSLVGKVDCEFRPVDHKWIAQLMGSAVWCYAGTDFPVLQAVYPDLENRFPPHTGVYLSETVHNGTEPVTDVSHDAVDGAWQFLGDSMSDGGGPVLSCLHHRIDHGPSLGTSRLAYWLVCRAH